MDQPSLFQRWRQEHMADIQEQETEPSPTGLRRRRESFVSSHRETKATAPVLDSTHRPLFGALEDDR